MILEYLTDVSSPTPFPAHSFPGADSTYHVKLMTPLLQARRLSLHSATLVCRSWHPVANKVLYTHPILISPRIIRQFAETIIRHPAYQAVVTGLFIYNFNSSPSPMVLGTLRSREGARTGAYLNQILASCINLTRLWIDDGGYYSPLNYLAGSTNLTNPISRLDNLHHLRTSGHAFDDSHAMEHLQKLHHLCFDDVTFPPTFVLFPYCPHLCTLRIMFSRVRDWGNSMALTASNLPSLKAVELKDNYELPREIMDPALLRQITSLHLEGTCEMLLMRLLISRDWISSQITKMTMGHIRSSTDGRLRDRYHLVKVWRPPRSTKHLTILLCMVDIWWAFLDLLVRFLREDLHLYPALRVVVLELDFVCMLAETRSAITPLLRDKFAQLRALCMAPDITFKVVGL